MSPKNRQLTVLTHVVLAGFFLPMALVFSITGGLYTFGIRGEYETTKFSELLTLPEEPTLNQVQEVSESFLTSKGVKNPPSGNPALKKVGTSWQFEWTGIKYDFTLEPTKEIGRYNIQIKDTGFHRFFVQLHKAKGGFPFKVLAGGLAIAFLLLFSSGVALAFTQPKLKRNLYVSLILGTLTFVILVAFS